MLVITSKDNPKVKRARSLHRRRERYRAREFLVEGVRLVEEAVKKKAPLAEAFISPELELDPRAQALVRSLEEMGIPVYVVAEKILSSIAETQTPQGMVAVCGFVELPLEPSRSPLYLVLDAVRDPGNVGAILRTACAAGVDCAFFTKGTADAWSPKVVRSAMGAHFALPIRYLPSFDELPKVDELWVSEPRCGRAYYDVDWRKSIALVVGGEAFGAGEEARKRATGTVSIPMARETESLNAAVAAGVILFEALRARSGPTPPISC